MSDWFKDLSVHLVPSGVGKTRVDLFKKKLIENGAALLNENQTLELPTNKEILILFEQSTFDSWSSLDKALSKKKFYISLKASKDSNFKFISTLWLSKCLEKKSCVEMDPYELKPVIPKAETTNKESNKRLLTDEPTSSRKKSKLTKAEAAPIDLNTSSDSEEIPLPKLDIESWSCAHSSKEQPVNFNKKVTDKLEELSQLYDVIGQKFKVTAYQKAIVGLKQCDHPITTLEVT